jgi:hypothetical protein
MDLECDRFSSMDLNVKLLNLFTTYNLHSLFIPRNLEDIKTIVFDNSNSEYKDYLLGLTIQLRLVLGSFNDIINDIADAYTIHSLNSTDIDVENVEEHINKYLYLPTEVAESLYFKKNDVINILNINGWLVTFSLLLLCFGQSKTYKKLISTAALEK